MDKKINLEHTIRVVVSESLGSGVTTDKYTRTGNSFFKSVHIEPKKGDEHVPLNGAVRTGRNVNKERSSETMKEEGQIEEASAKKDEGESWEPAYAMTPEEKTKREAARKKADAEAVKKAGKEGKFDPNEPGLSTYYRSPTEKMYDATVDLLKKSPVFKDIAHQKAQDLSNIAYYSPFGVAGTAADMAAADAQAKRLKGDFKPARAAGTGSAPQKPPEKTNLQKQVDAYQAAGQEKKAKEKAVELGIQVATGAAAAGTLKLAGKYLPFTKGWSPTKSLKGEISPKAAAEPVKPAEFDFIKPEKTGTSKVRSDFAKADAAASKFKPQAQKFDVTPPRTDAAPKASTVKPDAQFYNPKTGKTYKSKSESDIATKEFDLAAAARAAGGKAQAAKQADVSVPKGELPKVPPTAREPAAAPSVTKTTAVKEPPVSATIKAQKVSPAAREPAPFKPAEKPIEFKIATEPTSKGQVSVIHREPPTPAKAKTTDITTTSKAVTDKPLEGEIISPSNKQVAPAVSKPPKEITVDYKDVTPKTTDKSLVVTRPEIETKKVAKTDTETKTFVATRPEIKTRTATKTNKDETPPNKPPSKPPGRGIRRGGMFIPPFGLPGMPTDTGTPVGTGGSPKDVNTYLHKHGRRTPDRFAEEYNLQDAEEIKRKSRKAQIIRKIIDEQKKKKRDTSTVDLHPKLKNQEPDQN